MSNNVLEFNCETQELIERPMTEQELQAQEEAVEPSSNVSVQDSLQELQLLKRQILLMEEKLSSINTTQ